MIGVLVLLAIASVDAACPDSCKCDGGKVTCDLPEARNFPKLELMQNATILDLSGTSCFFMI